MSAYVSTYLLLLLAVTELYVATSPVNYTQVIYINEDTGENVEECLTSNNDSIPCHDLDWVFQQPQARRSSTNFVLSEGTHYLTQPSLPFQDLTSLAFTGSDSNVTCTQPGTGLAFINVVDISFHNISFFYCEAVRDSTSYNSINNTMSRFRVGLYFCFCESISMKYVSVSHSPEATGVVIYDTDGDNTFTECQFSNNTVSHQSEVSRDNETYPGGGGFYVEFTYCTPGSICDMSETIEIEGATFIFLSCIFSKNEASNLGKGGFIFPYKMNHQAFGRGGGLSLFLRGNTSYVTFTVDKCRFENNIALWGGGLFVELNDNVHGNDVMFQNTDFESNSSPYTAESGTAGGGLRFADYVYSLDSPLPFDASRNMLKIDNCTFVDNWALKGGGVALSWALQNTTQDKVACIITSNSSFETNWGKLGSALYIDQFWKLARLQGLMADIEIENCIFKNNNDKFYEKLHAESRNEPLEIGIGTMYVSSSKVQFSDTVWFENNTGSALAISDSNVVFDNCNAMFINNSGNIGAALTLLGASTMDVGKMTKMEFSHNSAVRHGGAIHAVYISRQNLVSDANCFIRHVDPFVSPNDWNVSMIFIDNTDHNGKSFNAIFTTSILPCIVLNGSDISESKNETFCWEGWEYYEDSITSSAECQEQINSDIGQIKYTAGGEDGPNYVKAFPGWEFKIPITILDDLDNDMIKHAIFSVQYDKPSLDDSYIWGDDTSISAQEGTTVGLTLKTVGERAWLLNILVGLLDCPPGFNINEEYKCRCCTEYRIVDVQCNEKDQEAKIATNIWMGKVNSSPASGNNSSSKCMYAITTCPYHYCSIRHELYTKLTDKSKNLEEEMCAPNRKGIICGECMIGYGPAVNSHKYECVPCTNISLATNIAKYVASVYLPLAFFFSVLIVFDIRLTTGPANAFILYSQVITTTFSLDANGGIPLDQVLNFDNTSDTDSYDLIRGYKFLYNIFNLNFIESYLPPFCFSEKFDTLTVLCLEYGVAFFPLLMIVITITVLKLKEHCCSGMDNPSDSKFVKFLKNRSKKINNALLPAFSAFLLLSYTKFCIISSNLTRTVQLSDEVHRLYLAGQYSTDNTEYYYYFVPGVIIFATFVAITPLLLLDYPLRAVEWLISKSTCLSNVYPADKIHILLDTFQGCYKKNMRFFAGLYFVFRLIINLSYVFCSTWLEQFVIQQLATTVLIMLIALLQPYTRKCINYVDILIFTNLTILNCFSLYLYVFYKTNPQEDDGNLIIIFIMQYFLVFLPLIFLSLYILWQWSCLKHAILKCIIPVINRFTSPSSPKYKQLYSFARMNLVNIQEPSETFSPERKYEPLDDTEVMLKRAEDTNKYKQPNLVTIVEVSDNGQEGEASVRHISGSSATTTLSSQRSLGGMYGAVRSAPEGSSLCSDKST